MRVTKKSRFAGTFVVVIALGLLTTNATVASAVTKKTITCYKGTAVKKITAVAPKCPTGWTTKKPVSQVVAFSGTYQGNLSILWSATEAKVTSLTGTSSDASLGLTKLTGTGGSTPSEQCSLVNGSGVLVGSTGNLNIKLDTTSEGCAEDSYAPTTIVIKGSALITGGTGKFVGATGTLKVNGSFSIKATTAGTSESDAFTVKLIGSIKTK